MLNRLNRQPAYRVTLDGKDLADRMRHRFSGLTLTEKRGGEADQLDLMISDHDGKAPLPAEGAQVALAIGWEGEDLVDKGLFTVDEPEWGGAPDVVTVHARSADFTRDLRLRREQSWRGKTLGDVLKAVAARQGLQAAIAPELAGIALPVLDQSRESDAALLRRLGRRYDAAATIKAGRLIFSPIGKGTTWSGAQIPAVTLTRRHGDQVSWKRPKRDDYAGVTADWHDVDAAGRKSVTVGKAEGAKKLRRIYGNQADAAQAARAAMTRADRAKSTFAMTLAFGRPDLYPERPVALQGFKPEIDATRWLIAGVTHTLSQEGFTTAIELESVG